MRYADPACQKGLVMKNGSDWFRRFLLPGFAFKAVVIGGGYATGRELITFFMPSGPWGGLLGMVEAMAMWSAVCVVTFLVAEQSGSRDYRAFFSYLLGPAWGVFELIFVLGMTLILAVFAAAAGAIGQALFGFPLWAGALALACSITAATTFGNTSVERLFKYVSIFLYLTYAVFLTLSLMKFGPLIRAAFDRPAPTTGWTLGGLTYAGYNIIGAVIVLPMVRHLRGPRDAIAAGLLAGPLAMIPALLFFVAMTAFYPAIDQQLLPSDFLLGKLDFPLFRLIFQAMIFAALLESGTGQVHAINERIANAVEASGSRVFGPFARLVVTATILLGSIVVADKIGLVTLIAQGYRWLAYACIVVFVIPLMTIGVWRVRPTLFRATTPRRSAISTGEV
jgi:uncharacterized membrane protein YkvI